MMVAREMVRLVLERDSAEDSAADSSGRPGDRLARAERAASFASHRLIGWIYRDPVAVEGAPSSASTCRARTTSPAGAPACARRAPGRRGRVPLISPAFIEFSMALAEQRTSYAAIAAVRDRAVVAGLHDYAARRSATGWPLADPVVGGGRRAGQCRAGCSSPRTVRRAAARRPTPVRGPVAAMNNCIRRVARDTHFAILAAEDVSAAGRPAAQRDAEWMPAGLDPRSRGLRRRAAPAAATADDLEERGPRAGPGEPHQRGRSSPLRMTSRRAPTGSASGRRHLGRSSRRPTSTWSSRGATRLVARIDATAGPEWYDAPIPQSATPPTSAADRPAPPCCRGVGRRSS